MRRPRAAQIIVFVVRLKRGQTAIEAALVMPLMVFFTLGLVQLTMLQQARLMTEYATYQAARAGIVWNGSNERMHDAAVMALLPTMGNTSNSGKLAETWLKHWRYDAALRGLPWGAPRLHVNGQFLTGSVRIDTITPNLVTDRYGLWKQVSGGNNWSELDFDGVETYPESPVLEAYVRKFFNLNVQDRDEEDFRRDTLLQIRLRYWYEMKIPFANQVIFLAWYAANADVALYGAIDRSTLEKQNMLGRSGDSRGLRPRAKGIWDPSGKGYPPVTANEMMVLWDIATGQIPLLGADRRFFIPLHATQSMRMQSSFYKKWIVHQ